MAEVTKAYDLNGFYIMNGVRGEQVGQVFYCSDGAVLGTINDDNRNPLGPPPTKGKLLLGLHFPEDDSLAFLKIAHPGECLYPVAWVLQSGLTKTERRLSHEYSGHWTLIMDGLPDIAGLEELIEQRDPRLFNIPANVLRENCFPSIFLGAIKQHGALGGQMGGITFTEKPLVHQAN